MEYAKIGWTKGETMKPKKSQRKMSVTLSSIAFGLVMLIIIAAAIFYFSGKDPNQTVEQIESLLGLEKEPEASSPAPSSKPSSAKTGDVSLGKALPADGQLSLIMLDVGQGDSLFLQMPNGQTMLVDTGEYEYWNRLDHYLNELKVNKIDALVATHPHSDHIGSMQSVINHYEIGQLYMPKVSHTSKTYENLLKTVQKHNMRIVALKGAKGQTIDLDPNVSIKVLAPISDQYEDLNNYSAVLQIEYKNVSFLLTGDAENVSEREMVDQYGKALKSDVLKVGHHGSNSSSKSYFLEAVQPKYALISCQQNNEYNHPHEKTISRLNKIKAEIFRTDLSGSIALTTDGKSIKIETSQ